MNPPPPPTTTRAPPPPTTTTRAPPPPPTTRRTTTTTRVVTTRAPPPPPTTTTRAPTTTTTARPTTTTTTTTTPTTTTRAPSACELERESLIEFNPEELHVPECMADGAFKPDQYEEVEAGLLSYCVDFDGNKLVDTMRLGALVETGARYEECLAYRQ